MSTLNEVIESSSTKQIAETQIAQIIRSLIQMCLDNPEIKHLDPRKI